MKATQGRPRVTGLINEFPDTKVVFVEKCSVSTYWYRTYVGQLLIVCQSGEYDSKYNVLEKMGNGKFANNGRYLTKEDTSFVCDIN
jgi:hypothetical protein